MQSLFLAVITILTMKGTDLRIGNQFIGAEMIQTVKEILHYGTQKGYEHLILVNECGNQYKPIEIKGIPIGGETLIKLGFKSIGKLHPTYKFKNYLIEAPMMGYYWGFRQIMNKEESVWLADIEFVHQLQNLYYALRSTELVLAATAKNNVA